MELKKSPIKEEVSLNPINDYGLSKVVCENLFKKSGVNGFIFRIFNVYGKNQYEKFLIPIILENYKKGEIVLTKGAKRDFIEVRDIVNAFILGMKASVNKVEVLNLGSGEETELSEIVDILIGQTGIKPKIDLRDPPTKEVSSIYADISKLKKILGFKPKISLEEGLRDLIAEDKLK